jgi:hypothetical protein
LCAYLTIDEARRGLSAVLSGGRLSAQMPNGSHMTEAELDHIASGIRPSWELDDGPFRPGGLASPELEALLALGASGNGVSHSHTNGAGQFTGPITAQRVVSLNAEPEDMLTRVDPVPPAPVLEDAPIAPVRVEAAAAAPLPVVPQFIAQAAPQTAAQAAPAPAQQSNRPPPPVNVAPSRPPPPSPGGGPGGGNGVSVAAQADPFAAPVEKAKPKAARAKSTSSADFPAIQKSNKGLYIALGGGAVALIVAVVAFTSSSGKGDTKTIAASPTATQMPGTSTTHEIPPPPATDDLPAATQAAATTQPAATAAPSATQTAAPTATQASQQAATAAPTHVAHNDSPPAATHHSSSPPHSNPPASGGSGKGKGGIVRDVPF